METNILHRKIKSIIPFHAFIDSLKVELQKPLPGMRAFKKLMPDTRKEKLYKPASIVPKKSAVLLLFYPLNQMPYLVFIKRAVDGGVHSSQIAFPGGQYETFDNSLENTAMRESYEEINIREDNVTLLGSLTKLYIPPSNFDVFPFVAYSTHRPDFKANEEVERIIEVSIIDLCKPETFQYKTVQHRTGKIIEVPCYFIHGEIIWGATAMLLRELIEVVNC